MRDLERAARIFQQQDYTDLHKEGSGLGYIGIIKGTSETSDPFEEARILLISGHHTSHDIACKLHNENYPIRDVLAAFTRLHLPARIEPGTIVYNGQSTSIECLLVLHNVEPFDKNHEPNVLPIPWVYIDIPVGN